MQPARIRGYQPKCQHLRRRREKTIGRVLMRQANCRLAIAMACVNGGSCLSSAWAVPGQCLGSAWTIASTHTAAGAETDNRPRSTSISASQTLIGDNQISFSCAASAADAGR